MPAMKRRKNRAHGALPQDDSGPLGVTAPTGEMKILWERATPAKSARWAYFPGLKASNTLPGCAPQLA